MREAPPLRLVWKKNTTFQALHVIIAQSATDRHLIALVNTITGMRQTIGQLTIVCEQEEARGFNIQPSDRIQTGTRRMKDQVNRPTTPFRVTVGADRAPWLKQHHVDVSTRLADHTPLSHDAITFWIDPGGQGVDDFAVHGDHS